jgi:RecB family exonuclease
VAAFLDVVGHGWRREEVIAFLKSSYTAPDCLTVEHLRRLAIKSGVSAGKGAWLSLASSGALAGHIDNASELSGMQETLSEMARFDDLLTGKNGPAADFVAAVREIITAFGLEGRIEYGEPSRQERDKSALIQGLNALNGIARIASVRQSAPISFREFHRLLLDAWENTSASPSTVGEVANPTEMDLREVSEGEATGTDDRPVSRVGPKDLRPASGVSMLEPREARDRRLRVCAIMGLTERVFPRRISEDPFLRDEERRLVRDWTGVELEEQRLHTDDERYLFYMAATAPSDQLLLSFPRSSNEKDTLPSFFLDNVRTVFESGSSAGTEAAPSPGGLPAPDQEPPAGMETCVRTLGDVTSGAAEGSIEADALLTACSELFNVQTVAASGHREAFAAASRIQKLMDVPGRAYPIAVALKSRNLPRLPGLDDEVTRLDFAGAKSTYTVAELETYGLCPFRYLLRHVLNVQAQSEGLDRARRSALIHTVLRRYFRERTQNDSEPIGSLQVNEVFEDLNKHLLDSLQSARLDPHDHRLQIQLQRLSEDLMGFAEREVRCAAQFGTRPTHFHLTFGRAPVAVAPDPSSSSSPLILTGPDGSVAISGFIDRVDVDETGRRAIIVEYETGHPPEFAAILRGASLQMPINLLAIERLFGLDAAAACYDSMLEQGRRRFHRTEHVNMRRYAPALPFDDPTNVKPLSREQFSELIATAEARAVRLARSIEEGSVAAVPGPHCNGCEFSDVCRTTVAEGHDGERQAGPAPASL